MAVRIDSVSSLISLKTYQQEVNDGVTRLLKEEPKISEDEENTQIYASLLPDEIIYNEGVFKERHYKGAILCADIAGFTDLCERFNETGKGGPSRITQVLNSYIGAMVQEIMTHGGDVLKFSGDAFLALWKSQETASMTDVVHASIDCAIGIQKSHGSYVEEVQMFLNVKITIAAGSVVFSIIGDSNFMLFGDPIMEIRKMGDVCTSGEVIITHTMRSFLELNDYIIEPFPNTIYYKVKSIGPEWTPCKFIEQYDIIDVNTALVTAIYRDTDSVRLDDHQSAVTLFEEGFEPIYHYYTLRPSLEYAIKKELRDYLRKFVIAPVARIIDLNEPLEHLTEMRQVVVVFINVITKSQSVKCLLEVSDKAYAIVAKLVNNIDGCVNKVSIFDKGLMILAVFGLSGLKHTLETQRALHCSKNIMEQLKNEPLIDYVSIGVTSGITYCGVVGHPMRKEYTVIGRGVNKAARLMAAYKNKITCDRQTFLHSNLQARYFTLQPYIPLKGFQQIEPVYEFNDETEGMHVLTRDLSKLKNRPLLDRYDEMGIFYRSINKMGSRQTLAAASDASVSILDSMPNYKMLIIKGEPRQGKTRLLNEMVFCVPLHVSTYHCLLTSKDKKVMYNVIKCVCNKYLELTNVTDSSERTETVALQFSDFKIPALLCALNDVLNVEFVVTKQYMKLREEQREQVKNKLIDYFARKICKDSCFIAIDNGEYMDNSSWNFLKTILECDTVFICCTMGIYSEMSEAARGVVAYGKTLTLTLRPINEWYHAAIICQILEVQGIPIELEKYIQAYSGGNPGWMESFLTTLIHSNDIQEVVLEKRKAERDGIVLPPSDMLIREPFMSMSLSSLDFSEEVDRNFFDRFDVVDVGWNIYRHTVLDSARVDTKSGLAQVPICIMPTNIHLEDIKTEDVLDVHLMRTYDSLKIQEQHLLKCSSILGDEFSRQMLQYILRNPSPRKVALAIQRLFEIQVYSCARGRYFKHNIVIKHHLTDPKLEYEIVCECEGFPPEADCTDLPKYAMCGYIRFREPKFRKMLYDLLTDTQMKMYHKWAIMYLSNETRKCSSCGNGYFIRLNGEVYNDGMRESTTNITVDDKQSPYDDTASSIYEMSLTKSVPLGTEWLLNFTSLKEIRTFADNNLLTCDCQQILNTMYTQMIWHCQAISKHEKLMHALLEYTALCIKQNNVAFTWNLLQKATKLLNEKLQYELMEPLWQVPLFQGRIATLQGLLHIERRALDEAERNLLQALRYYNLEFPLHPFTVRTKIKYLKMKLLVALNYFPQKYVGALDAEDCIASEQTSEALSCLYYVYRSNCQYNKAYLAAIWCLDEALKSDSNFYVMCCAYANFIMVEIWDPMPSVITKIEEMALATCYRKHIRLEQHELEAVIRMYIAIFFRRSLCRDLTMSLEIGFVAMQINLARFEGRHRWLLLPMFQCALTCTYHITQAVNLIQHMSSSQNDLEPMTYLTMCIDFRLDTSYCVIPFSECEVLNVTRKNKYAETLRSIVEMRYISALWLWYLRKEDWANVGNLYQNVIRIMAWPFIRDVSMMQVNCNLLEGFMLFVVQRIEMCDIDRIKKFQKHVKMLFKFVKNFAKRMNLYYARYLHLKAYWEMINNKQVKAFKLLDRALHQSVKHRNKFEIDWVIHNRKLWENKLTKEEENLWMKDVNEDYVPQDWNTYDSEKRTFPFFSYRLPQQINYNEILF